MQITYLGIPCLIWLSFLLTFSQAVADQHPLLTEEVLSASEQAAPETDLPDLWSIYTGLLEIDSTTGNEKAIGQHLRDILKKIGFNVELREVESNRFNVYAWQLGYPEEEVRVLLTSHIDTVPPFIPYSITWSGNSSLDYNDGTFWGRGTVDAKASVAAQITAAVNILKENRHSSTSRAKPSPDSLAFLYVVGEETNGKGMRHFSSHATHNYSSIIFGEPTEGKLVCGHKGIMGFDIAVTGKAAHSGYPWHGVDANDILIDALSRLRSLEPKLPRSKKYGLSTMNIGRIDGGAAANVIAASAMADIAIRLAGGQPQDVKTTILSALEPVIKRAKADGGHLEVRWSGNLYAPVDMECSVEGFDETTVNYGTDVPNMEGTHKRYLYGPGSILLAHGPKEHLRGRELSDSVDAYEKLIHHVLQDGKS